MNRCAAGVLIAAAAMAIAPESVVRPAAAQAQQQPESAIAQALRAALRADPALATLEIAETGDEGARPPSASAALATFRAKSPTFASCAALGAVVEAWSEWAQASMLWQFALAGLPDAAAAHNTKAAAGVMLTLSVAAAQGLDQAIEQADRQSALRLDEAAEQELASALHAREVVLRLRAARGAIVVAALTEDANARAALARAVVELCRQVPGVSAWAETERTLLLGHAGAMLGEAQEASKLFAGVERGGPADELPAEFAADVRLEAMLGGVLARAASAGVVASQRELDAAAAREPAKSWLSKNARRALLVADASLRMSRMLSAGSGDQSTRDQSLALALARYADVLRVADPTMSRDAVLAMTLDHLAAIIPARETYRGLHPVAALARARALESTPDSLGRAIALLDETLARPPGELGGLTSLTLFQLATACARQADAASLQRAVELLLAFADRFPSDEKAGLAVAMACAAADRLLRLEEAEPGAGPTGAQRVEIALNTLRRAHTSGVDVPQRDAWRLALARLLIWRIESGLVAQTEAMGAAREVAAVTGAVRDRPLALKGAVERAAAWNAVLALPDGDPEAMAEVSTRVLAAVEDVRAEFAGGRARDGAIEARVAVFEARALLASGRAAEAYELLLTVLRTAPSSMTARVQAEALAVALEAQIRLATPIERALETAQQLEALRVGAARNIIERRAAAIWNQMQPQVQGFIATNGATPRLGAESMLVLRLASRLAGEIDSGPAGEAAARRFAWALLLSGSSAEAAVMFENLSRARPDVPEYRRGSAEAHLAGGDDQQAFARFREIVASVDNESSADLWFAWTRMLEILARNNDDGRRTAEIRREIARLRTLQSALERPECLARLRAIEDALPAR